MRPVKLTFVSGKDLSLRAAEVKSKPDVSSKIISCFDLDTSVESQNLYA
jgi:hypothetical protein